MEPSFTTEPLPLEGVEELGALTLSDWLWAGGLILGAGIAAWAVRRAILKVATPGMAPLVARLIARFAAGLVFVLGFLYAMGQVGVSIAPLLGLIGIFGLALAFAFQEVLENFIAGVFLSVRRPFAQGDEIATADHEGRVEDVSLRAVTLRTYDGMLVYIPNSAVWRNPIINRTTLGARRTTLGVGVDYDADLAVATDLLVEAMSDVDGVAADPAPQAYVYEFGNSSINIAMRYWHESPVAAEWQVRDAVAKRTKSALDAAGIGIPFPQRVVTMLGASEPG